MAEVISLEAVRRSRIIPDHKAEFDCAMDTLLEAGRLLSEAPWSVARARELLYQACQTLVEREERLFS